uniref:Conserved oligomeric Golgi complex subunit 6 n=1 Tax=Gasterosteus aculeatus TaxID=69293 RepID=G3PDV2_GASAC
MADPKLEMSSDNSTALQNPNAHTQPNNPLSRKLNKILETRLDNDKEMLEALKALSVFFTDNSLRTRRNLRGDIERRSLSINEDFARIFKDVKEALESVNEDVQAMSACSEEMTNRLKAAKEQTQDLIVKTNKLQGENELSKNSTVFQ